MTTAADPHEEFEIAALRRARGALDADGAARLEAHFATCASCRGFAATAEATETALRGTVRKASRDRDWERVRAGLDRRVKELRTRLGRSLWLTSLFVALGWAFQGPSYALLMALACVVTLAALFLFWVLPRERAARHATRSDRALMAYYRADLDKEIGYLKAYKPLTFALGVAWVVIGALTAVHWHESLLDERPIDWKPHVLAMLVNVIVVANFAYQAWYRLPRLERERKDLA